MGRYVLICTVILHVEILHFVFLGIQATIWEHPSPNRWSYGLEPPLMEWLNPHDIFAVLKIKMHK